VNRYVIVDSHIFGHYALGMTSNNLGKTRRDDGKLNCWLSSTFYLFAWLKRWCNWI